TSSGAAFWTTAAWSSSPAPGTAATSTTSWRNCKPTDDSPNGGCLLRKTSFPSFPRKRESSGFTLPETLDPRFRGDDERKPSPLISCLDLFTLGNPDM